MGIDKCKSLVTVGMQYTLAQKIVYKGANVCNERSEYPFYLYTYPQ